MHIDMKLNEFGLGQSLILNTMLVIVCLML
jgi:hypothetical protein